MSFKKPYRICNRSASESWSLVPDPSEAVCAILKEAKDRYELRISIPAVQQYRLSVAIKQGILHVYASGADGKIEGRLLGAFVLPANILWPQVKAYCCSYGLWVQLPLAQPDGIVIHVPVLPEGGTETS